MTLFFNTFKFYIDQYTNTILIKEEMHHTNGDTTGLTYAVSKETYKDIPQDHYFKCILQHIKFDINTDKFIIEHTEEIKRFFQLLTDVNDLEMIISLCNKFIKVENFLDVIPDNDIRNYLKSIR